MLYRLFILTISYIGGILRKLVDTLMSVKVWILISTISISTYLVMHNYISGDNFTTLNTTVIGLVIGMREIFKVSRIKRLLSFDEIKKIGI